MEKKPPFQSFRGLSKFLVLFSGQSVSQFGTAMSSFAILIWVYKQNGSAMAVSLLSICSLAPYIVASILGGVLTDRAKKKVLLLVCDGIAAMGSLAVLLLFVTNSLQVWHLFIINAVNGLMNAFQGPASEVAVTLLVPNDQYVRAGGIKSTVSSVMGILTPIVATSILAFGGLGMVLTLDLATFLFAFLTLLFLVKIPATENEGKRPSIRSIPTDIREAFSFLKTHKGILYLLLFFGVFNLVGAMSFNSLLSPMILARTNNNEMILGVVSSTMAISGLCSGILISLVKPAKNKTRMMFLFVEIAFLVAILLFGMGRSVIWWCITCFGSIGIPIYFAYEGAILRENIPSVLQGRMFSIKGMFSQMLMPIGYFLGGFLADRVFEPFMLSQGKAQTILHHVVGCGKGAGMGLMFVICGIIGFITCLIVHRNRHIQELNRIPSTPLQ